ncbi:MAG: MATE family efflux transporter [Rhodobacteraceae bacterium]|nr:MATE family efflux transporter [Paracoccaceae bacterium]
MTYSQHARAVVNLGAPLVGSQLAQIAIQTTDTLMLGWYGVTELAAVTVASALYFIVFILGAGLAWAVVPLAAAAAEMDDTTQVRRVTRMGLWACFVFCVPAVPLLLSAGWLLNRMGQDPAVAALAGDYLGLAGWMLVPALVVMVLRSFLSALELTQIVLWVTLGAAGLNVLLNYAFIFGNLGAPELGVRGAALASVTIMTVSALALLVYILRRLPDYDLLRRLWRPDWSALGRVFQLGWPIGVTNIAEVGLFGFSSLLVGWLGAVPLAAHGIALQLASITFMVHIGLSQAATVRAGRALGRHDATSLKRGARVVIALSGAMVLLTVVVFLGFPHPLIGLFMAPDEPARAAILATGTVLLACAALFQLADAVQVIALGLLRGVQDTRVPMIFATVSYWAIGAPAGYLFGFTFGLGAPGVWLGLVLGLSGAAVTMMTRFWRRSVREV